MRVNPIRLIKMSWISGLTKMLLIYNSIWRMRFMLVSRVALGAANVPVPRGQRPTSSAGVASSTLMKRWP